MKGSFWARALNERGSEKLRFLAFKSPYLRNNATQNQVIGLKLLQTSNRSHMHTLVPKSMNLDIQYTAYRHNKHVFRAQEKIYGEVEIFIPASFAIHIWKQQWKKNQPTLAKVILTRKPSWRKSKRATAVHVWRPLAKKSTANQWYVISYWRLIVTAATLLTVCEIFSCVEVQNRHFHPLYFDCRRLVEECPAIST